MLEKYVQQSVIQYLQLKRIFHWRNNTGGVVSTYKDRTYFHRYGAIGSPDIFVIKNGKIFGIECKADNGKQSENQVVWQKDFEQAGGIYLLVKSVDDVIKIWG